MIFTTPEFAFFFIAFFAVFGLTRGAWRKGWLLVASYAFYGSWNWKFLGLLGMSTLVDFVVARRLDATEAPAARKKLLAVSLAVNLGALGFFKYSNFFIQSAIELAGRLGVDANVELLEIVLPVGISFYTFQTLSYTIDVYRKKLAPTQSLLDFAVYVALFPQLVAGPIERASHLLPQIARIGTSSRALSGGFTLIAIGAFKKVIIADNLAGIVRMVYTHPADAYAPALWIGTYAFALQIYCDFSGYSDMAVGLGRLMGIEIMQNFRAPYASAGPSEFWRRWHISLSTWLRDYLYIPLGGNRGGPVATGRNLMLTMLLGGLWHGAAWNFVLWGAYHGLLLVFFRPAGWRRLANAVEQWPRVPWFFATVFRRLVFFHLVCIGWALFRAGSLEDCAIIVEKLVDVRAFDFGTWWSKARASSETPYIAVAGSLAAMVLLVQNLLPRGSHDVAAFLTRMPPPVRFAFVAALLYAAAIFAPVRPAPFVYFQF